jgi:glycosyltransferase involved in cell wall biosynthesis
MKIRVVIDNHHMDHSGGGEHVRMLLSLFSRFAEVYVTKDPDFYSENNLSSTPLFCSVKKYRYDFTPELFVYISYRGYAPAFGRVNAQLCYYAVEKPVVGYDYALCINDFVARSASRVWGVTPVVVPPYFDFSAFSPGSKKKSLVNIGNFFMEGDGHSKNQHLLVDWFLSSGLAEEGWTFDFFGFLNNDEYFSELKDRASSCASIRFHPNCDRVEMLSALGSARFMVHAMGYGRSDSAQTEHFGLVAVQALLSGCRPIVHRSGGCYEIEGTIAYDDMREIRGIIESDSLEVSELRALGEKYSFEASLAATSEFMDIVKKRCGSDGSGFSLVIRRFLHLLHSIKF